MKTPSCRRDLSGEGRYLYSAGFKLFGTLDLPDKFRAGEKLPTVLCCHGLRANRKVILPEFARAFVKQGYAAFVFDYRGFGESEGTKNRNPRRLTHTYPQDPFENGSSNFATTTTVVLREFLTSCASSAA